MPSLFSRIRARAAAGDSPEAGSALILVIGLGMTLTLVITGLSGYALQGYVTSKNQTDWSSAVAAAQAGFDDYLSRLNDDDNYWTRGNVDATNPAFTSWTLVPGTQNNARYRYSVDITATGSNGGLIKLTSSGKVANEVRTVSATLRRGKFFDFVYFSDFETGDPANQLFYTSSYWNTRDENAICGRYNWASGFNSRDSNCPRIFWRDDEIIGKFHTNDTFFVSGTPRFNGTVTSGCPVVQTTDPCNGRDVFVKQNTSDRPSFASRPNGGVILPMPASNSAIRREADPTQGGTGCLYTGPTRIVLKSDGRMAVNSPSTTTVPSCGVGANATLPANGVIYVQNVPSSRPNPATCSSGRPWVSTPSGVTLDSTSAGSTYPASSDRTAWDCRAGDVFIEGNLRGQLTIASENSIVPTGNIRYVNGTAGSDILGLIAQNNISIYHPINSSGNEILSSSRMNTVEIWAAMLTVVRSFNVQNYNSGTPKGDLIVRGSIAQKWRGAVSTFSGTTLNTGYNKDYAYDSRLTYLSPPKFLDPVAASWVIGETSEDRPIAP
jgi:hypothetical protein